MCKQCLQSEFHQTAPNIFDDILLVYGQRDKLNPKKKKLLGEVNTSIHFHNICGNLIPFLRKDDLFTSFIFIHAFVI